MPKQSDKSIVDAIVLRLGKAIQNVKYNEMDEAIELDLSKLGISELPTEVWDLKSLERLDLSSNRLTALPKQISQLNNLIHLDISHNNINTFPDDVLRLLRLRFLYIRNNGISNMPLNISELKNLYSLHLSYNPISYLPDSIISLQDIQIIDISNTHILSFPVEIVSLKNLRILIMRGNGFDVIPEDIGGLLELKSIDLFDNHITRLPESIANLKELTALNLSINKLQEVPPILASATHLNRLHLAYNKIKDLNFDFENLSAIVDLDIRNNLISSLPDCIGSLSNLEYLDASNNYIDYISSSIGKLKQLIELRLRRNLIKELPNQIALLENLEVLDVNDNLLSHLPTQLGNLPKLKNLEIQNNPTLLNPPPEIAALGTDDILAYLREIQQDSVIRYEAKLLIVGEGGTGKSSLLRALRGEKLDLFFPTTHGIEVDAYQFVHPSKPSVEITLNTWDFGGQQIYHATHQFFLTRRSLYLIVWNARLGAEQGRLYYWLDTIKAIAPDARVILVATHTDERTPDLNYQAYITAFPQLSGNFSVSNKTGEGIDKLKIALSEQAALLPIMGQIWPKSWLDVETSLSRRTEPYIDADEYTKCCNQCGVSSEIAQGTLGSYLHDLGKILYFHDDFVLSNLVVLKANWVTKAISRVLSDENTRNAKGVLTHSELPRIWSHDDDGRIYGRYLYPVFLRLMERFDLSYQIAADEPSSYSSRSLVPQLLPFEPPVILPTWPKFPPDGEAQVQMIYRINFVPSGIISWFIVRTHQYTSNIHWREGVLLSYEGHSARVELIPALRELRLVVWGLQPQNFFTILMKTMDLILNRFEGLDIERTIPCICHWTNNKEIPCPRSYRYEDLVRRMETRRYSVECPESFMDVSVMTLLYGIHMSTNERVMNDIKKNQEEILSKINVSQEENVLLKKLEQKMELVSRGITRQWNLEMNRLDSECPGIFCIMPEQSTVLNIRDWFHCTYRMYLLCQHPSKPHIVGDGYILRKPEDWWVKMKPWLNYLTKFLRYGIPLGQAIGEVYDQVTFKTLESNIDLIEEISKSLPELIDVEYDEYSTEESYFAQNQKKVGAALRVLYSFLSEVDENKYWGGLNKIITPDGNILWLCDVHQKPYEPKPLIIE